MTNTNSLKGPAGPPQATARVLVVDDLADARWILTNLLRIEGLEYSEAASGGAALHSIRQNAPDLVLLDVGLPDMDGFEVLARIKALDKAIPVVMITANGNTLDAVRAIRNGAFDYLAKPFHNQDVALTVRHVLAETEARRQVRQIHDASALPDSLMEKMGQSAAVQGIQTEVDRVAATNFSVLVTGESGTGKELVTQAIHARSLRADKPFVALDCGSIPDNLIESELFGHEKGSFTGAHQAKAGAFELAAGGTIFLDEIGNLPLAMQGKLLRVLETRRIHRIGSTRETAVDFRVVAATNANLLDMVEKQTFRGDLYHRLAEYTISIPALQDRKEDLAFLVNRFLLQTNKELGKQVRGPNAPAWELIRAYGWPGNARELRNQLRRAVLLCDEPDGMITPRYLGMISGTQVSCLQAPVGAVPGGSGCWSEAGVSPACLLCDSANERLKAGADLPLKDLTARVVSQIERSVLLKALEVTQCNKAMAARMLHIDYKTLHKKLKEHAIFSNPTLTELRAPATGAP